MLSTNNDFSIRTLPLDGMLCVVSNTNYTNAILVYHPTETMKNTTNHIPNALDLKTIEIKGVLK